MNVLLIDDHPLLNAGLVSILEATGLFTVCGQAKSIDQAISFIEEAAQLPSLIILDLMLGKDNGLDFLPMLGKYCSDKKIPRPPVLICSAFEDPFKIQAALKLGAAGFLSKTSGRAELLKAIDIILNGKVYISDELNITLREKSDMYSKFTKREIDVIHLLKQNKTNRFIADALFISLRTVENYISKIYFKTGFINREELQKL